MKYVALLRGINVGGNNKIPMSDLKDCFESLGYKNVKTYINSGNVLFESSEPAAKCSKQIEALLLKKFPGTTMPIKVLVISHQQIKNVIEKAPKGFGQQPQKYHSDTVFLISKTTKEVQDLFELHPEVDKLWLGEGVVYFQRLSALRTKSRLGRIIGKPIYKNMTIRSWNTTTKLLQMLEEL